MRNVIFLFFVLVLLGCRQTPEVVDYVENKKNLSPDKRYGELFEKVQFAGLFPDSKTFADCTPKMPTDAILAAYDKESLEQGFDIKTFVENYFITPPAIASDFQSDTSRTATEHINVLWDVLTRQPDSADAGTLIPLPNAYVVPGGRFREVYYWDSYFTMLGLQVAEQWDMIENMVDNFSYLIETMGFIPNGNRTYYQGRSQPPFYALMVNLLAEGKGKGTLESIYRIYKRNMIFGWMVR